MKQLLTADILDVKQQKLSKAETKVSAKTAKIEAVKDKENINIKKQIDKANVKFQIKREKIEQKSQSKVSSYDAKIEIASKIEDSVRRDKKINALNELKANIQEYYAKRIEDLEIDTDILSQNFDWMVKDLESGSVKTISYNDKVYVQTIHKKYAKMNFKKNWKEIKEEINAKTYDSNKDKNKALKEASVTLYEESDKLYKPSSLIFKDYFNSKFNQLDMWFLNVKKKWSRCSQWTFKEWVTARIWTIPAWMYIVFLLVVGLGIGFNTMYANSHDNKQLIGGEMMYPMAILLVIAIISGAIFSKIPIWNKYLGGALMGSMFVGAFLVFLGAIPKDGPLFNTIDHWFSDDNFLSMYIAVLLVGAVLLIPRKMIIKATGGFFLIIIIGSAAATGLGLLAGYATGTSTQDLILNYALPILADGNGGGIQPIDTIAKGAGYDNWISGAMAVSTVASILSVLGAGILNGLGKAKPSWSGDGQLVRRDIHTVERPVKSVDRNIAAGLLLILIIYIMGDYVSKLLTDDIIGVKVPNFAWMIIICLVINVAGIIPSDMRQGVSKVNTFISKQTTWLLMVGVGICNIELDEFFKALNGTTLLISLAFIVGAIIGPMLVAKLFRFNSIESALSAGLCMTAQGGSGAIAVLGTSNRMELMPYGQITCRIAGSVVLVFAGIAFSAWPNEANQAVQSLVATF